jgi:hypothetical protein
MLAAVNTNTAETSTLREEIGSLQKLLQEALDRLGKLEAENNIMNDKIIANNAKISKLEVAEPKKNKQEEERITEIEKRQEIAEQINRKNKIIIKGPAINYDEEDLRTEVINKLSAMLHIQRDRLSKSTFQKFGKMGKCVLMTVQEPDEKYAIFEAVRTVKPASLSINEFLTPAKAKLIYELRKLKFESGKFKSVFSMNGKVYVTYSEKGQKYLISNLSDIQ